MRRDFWAGVAVSACTALVVSILVTGVRAWADLDSDDSTDGLPRVVPYEGVIDLDGSPYTGFLDMKFTLYDAPSGGNAVWTEDWTLAQQRAVQVFAGRFAATLGTFDDGGLRSLEDVIADAGPVYLGVEVKHTDDADDAWVALNGRQRLNPVPYALWSNKASNLDVAGTLTVGGTTTLSGNLGVSGTTTLSGPVNVRGNMDVSNPIANSSNGASVTVDDDLAVTGSITNPNGDVRVNDTLRVDQAIYDGDSALTINDDATISGTLTVTGEVSDSNSDLVVNDGLDVRGNLYDGSGDLVVNDPLDVRGNVYNGGGDVIVNDPLDVRGNVYNGSGNTVTVNDALSVNGTITANNNGDLNISHCRICFNTKHDDGGDRYYACVRLVPGASSGWRAWDVDINDNDNFALTFVCDGGGDATGKGSNVGIN